MRLLDTKITFHFRDDYTNTYIVEYSRHSLGWMIDIFKNNRALESKMHVDKKAAGKRGEFSSIDAKTLLEDLLQNKIR